MRLGVLQVQPKIEFWMQLRYGFSMRLGVLNATQNRIAKEIHPYPKPALDNVFSVTDSVCLAQYSLWTVHVVSPTLNVGLTFLVGNKKFGEHYEIYDVAVVVIY